MTNAENQTPTPQQLGESIDIAFFKANPHLTVLHRLAILGECKPIDDSKDFTVLAVKLSDGDIYRRPIRLGSEHIPDLTVALLIVDDIERHWLLHQESSSEVPEVRSHR